MNFSKQVFYETRKRGVLDTILSKRRHSGEGRNSPVKI